MLALSAGSPFFKGFLSDTDCRWSVIAQSVDDRREEEKGGLIRVDMQVPVDI